MIQSRNNISDQRTTNAAKGSAASWINAGNPIEKNSRVNLFLSFGRLSSPSLSSSLLLTACEEVLVAIHSLLIVGYLLLPMFLVRISDGCDSERPFTAIYLLDDDKHSDNNSRREGAVTNTRTSRNRKKETAIIIHYFC